MKSRVAFLLNCRQLFELTDSVYFWTFTFPMEVQCARQANRFWKWLNLRMGKLFGSKWCGVRVLELHPGGHGWHFHALITGRLPAGLVWRIAAKYHFGRVDVRKARLADGDYLAKYLLKETDFPRGVRKWAVIGRRYIRPVKVKNIVCNSELSLNMKAVREVVGSRMSNRLAQWVGQMTIEHGNLARWPLGGAVMPEGAFQLRSGCGEKPWLQARGKDGLPAEFQSVRLKDSGTGEWFTHYFPKPRIKSAGIVAANS